MATRTPKELAQDWDTDPRTVRKFLRSNDIRVGKGNRHAIEAKDVRKLRKQFDAWVAAKVSADESATEKADEALEDAEVDEIEDEVLEVTETE